MHMRCSNCDYLNDASRQRRDCAECGASLKDAEIVAEGPSEAENSHTDNTHATPLEEATASGPNLCSCVPPLSSQENPHICQYCDGHIVTSQQEEVEEGVQECRPEGAPLFLIIPDVGELAVGEGAVVGRERSAMVSPELMNHLSNATGISRKHVWFGSDEDYLYIVDLGSKNGTWVDYEQLTPLALHRFSRDSLPAKIHLGGKVAFYVRCGKGL